MADLIERQSQPAWRRDEHRHIAFFLGYTVAGAGILWAFVGGAGVMPSPANFASGPTSASLSLLYVTVGVVVLGAAIVARFGSIYPNVPELGATLGKAEPTRRGPASGRFAVFFVILGVGLSMMGLSLPLLPWCLSHGPAPCAISPSVVYVPHTLDVVGLALFALGIGLFVLRGLHHRPELRAWWRRTGRYVTVTGVAALVVVSGLLVIPVHQTFSNQTMVEAGSNGIGFWIFPTGVEVAGSWTTSPSGLVNFTIQGPSGTIYTDVATSGAFSFTASGTPWPLYTFYCSSSSHLTLIMSGSYNAPTWTWPPGEPTSLT
jgi:hypothetical protein